MHTNVYPKAHTWSTINALQKASKQTVEILVTNIALHVDVSYGEGDRGKRIGQGNCCQVIDLELEK